MTLQSILGFRECEAAIISDSDVSFLKSQMQMWKHRTSMAAQAVRHAKGRFLLCEDPDRREELEDVCEQRCIAFIKHRRIYKRNLRNYLEVQ